MSPCALCRKVVDGGIIEFLIPCNDFYIIVFFLQPVIKCKGGFLGTVILGYYKFKILIFGSLLNGSDTVFKILSMILVRYYYRKQRKSLYGIGGVIHSPHSGKLRLGTYSGALKMLHDSSSSGLIGIKLVLGPIRRGSLSQAPVIKHLGNMSHNVLRSGIAVFHFRKRDLSSGHHLRAQRFLYASEHKVIILGPVKLGIKAAHPVCDHSLTYKKVSDIIMTSE